MKDMNTRDRQKWIRASRGEMRYQAYVALIVLIVLVASGMMLGEYA